MQPDDEDPAGRDGGGDPACRLAQVCDACGGLPDGEPEAVCARCGAPTPTS